MIYYFLILFYWLFFYAFGKKEITNTRLFFAILPLFLIMALKSVSVGSDTISYYNRYVGAVEMLSAANAITEPGYNLISYFFHDFLNVPFGVFNALMSLFICYVLALFLKHFSTNIYLSLFIYMSIGMFTMSMSGLRQTLAISICMVPVIWAKVSAEKGKETRKYKFWRLLIGILLVLAASTLHNSAIIFIPILFLMNMRLTRQQTIMIMAIAIATLLFRGVIVGIMGDFLFGRYEQYDLEEGYMMNTLALLVPIAIGLFCVLVSRPNNGDLTYSKALSLMFIFLALLVTFNNLALSHNQIARLGYYFMNSYIVLIPFALNKLSYSSRPVVTLAIIVLCLVYFYLGSNEGTLKIDDYKFFWQDPIYINN